MCCVVTVGRFAVLSAEGPPGVDGGNWLAFADDLFGNSVRSASIVYPPVVPLLARGAVGALGVRDGMATVAALSAAAPAIAVFVVARSHAQTWWAWIAGLGVLTAPAVGESAAWGGYPQLLGTAMFVFLLWQVDHWLCAGGLRHLLAGAALGLGVLATSHFVALVAAIAVVALAVSHTVRGGDRRAVGRRAVVLVAMAGAASLPLIPLYLGLFRELIASRGAEPALATIDIGEIPGRFREIHDRSWPVVFLASATAVGALLLTGRRSPRATLWPFSASLWIAVAAGWGLTREPRVLHLLPVVTVLGIGASSQWSQRRLSYGAGALALGAVLLVAATGAAELGGQRDRYATVDPVMLKALEWLRDQTPPHSVVLVGRTGDAPLGWWVEGLARRRALYAAPLRWLAFADERARTAAANEVFHVLGMPNAAAMRRAAELGAALVLVPRQSPFTNGERLAAWVNQHGAVFKNRGAVILRVDADADQRARTRNRETGP